MTDFNLKCGRNIDYLAQVTYDYPHYGSKMVAEVRISSENLRINGIPVKDNQKYQTICNILERDEPFCRVVVGEASQNQQAQMIKDVVGRQLHNLL